MFTPPPAPPPPSIADSDNQVGVLKPAEEACHTTELLLQDAARSMNFGGAQSPRSTQNLPQEMTDAMKGYRGLHSVEMIPTRVDIKEAT